MTIRTTLLAAAAALAVLVPSAQAQQRAAGPAGGTFAILGQHRSWTVTTGMLADGRTPYCAAYIRSGSNQFGMSLHLAADGFGLQFRLNDNRWPNMRSRTERLSIDVDGEFWNANAFGMDSSGYNFGQLSMPVTDLDFVRTFMNGNTMRVRFPTMGVPHWIVPLDGSAAAYATFRHCLLRFIPEPSATPAGMGRRT